MAEDVAGLDLRGTELVVLSACDTARGEVRAGEGIFGLQRAFWLAGARTLVMSLWSVPDAATRELMELFYARLLAGRKRCGKPNWSCAGAIPTLTTRARSSARKTPVPCRKLFSPLALEPRAPRSHQHKRRPVFCPVQPRFLA